MLSTERDSARPELIRPTGRPSPTAAQSDHGGSVISARPDQKFGSNPVDIRDTGHYTQEYIPSFVEKWDSLIDWEKRAESEGRFFIDLLRKRGVKKVLDVATGTGFHSVRLLEAGFDTVSADGSAEMLAQAFANGMNKGDHVLRVVRADWRWLNRDVHGEYDAIVCLGNSFTHLFSERDRRKALAEFYAMLKHDGILVLDQRNYDAILDRGYSSKHTYYYCGEDVAVAPDYVDEGLCRMRYDFPDGSVYHLNMFPLRKDYTRRLMSDVGFQHIETYGDFQHTYRDEEPDFFIHVAEKEYRLEADDDREATYAGAVRAARSYYNSSDADTFYATVWGGEDIHIGLYDHPAEPIAQASRRTVERMAAKLGPARDSVVLDLGSGFGGSARYLAETHGCRVLALNLSEVENERHRELNAARGLTDRIEVVDGSFEAIPYPDASVDVVWSQDAFLHSGHRARVLEEAARVLRPGGHLIFTDPMQADGCPSAVLQPILDRIHLDDMGSPAFYARELARLGFTPADGTGGDGVAGGFEEHREHLVTHYSRVLQETERQEANGLAEQVSSEYLAQMKKGLARWVDGGRNQHLTWGIFHYVRGMGPVGPSA
ncbi:class I SAM-dependent methyltransferase [Streptomyces sp. TRM68367]|uniref:glycine/sarcosine N-methyltransferase n=1 Tax=Streptomyces sp. TRM68367 TaxID=2758415 RepID=UPI00165C4D50|nr:class I SAM-dependent methyltransferase [Streptomyces sp. TRM68367]MBC9725208.1 methyltransferase domain-containing protein [Streptomyces sp. TRM68367]